VQRLELVQVLLLPLVQRLLVRILLVQNHQ
jgi:hypothetical protein